MIVSTISRPHARYTLNTQLLSLTHSRTMMTKRAAKQEGTIADVFTTLSPSTEVAVLPARFAQLKKDVIPRVSFTDIERGLSNTQKDHIKKSGVVIVTGAVPKRQYIAANPVKGFPANDIQRTHPAILRTQQELPPALALTHQTSTSCFSTPISYFDRLRIRTPGDRSFTGSVERWEDPMFRRVFRRILAGGACWRSHDPFDVSWRMDAKQDLYNAPGQCSVFRCWQGWTSLSTTGVGEATAYIMLRPFFRPGPTGGEWELDLESSSFPGSVPGKGQELNEETHPHLRLGETMTSVPEIQPGDQVYWHCDTVHSVEQLHGVPLSVKNDSRDADCSILAGTSREASGESTFAGRATAQDITTSQGRRNVGGGENNELIDAANRALFGRGCRR
ncbi:DUF1479-domain-containing protein [Suillus subluteus]|nr:DUF1479-domain-containing protein [Suillus subluteus]